MRVLLYGATAALLMALFFPLLGATVDHHFAERQPGHLHIFLAGTPTTHLHHHEALHSHEAADVAMPVAESARAILKNNVIFLPSDGKGTAGTPTFGITLVMLTAAIAIVISSMLTQVLLPGQKPLRGVILSLEPPPPRPAL